MVFGNIVKNLKLKRTKVGRSNFWYLSNDEFIGKRVALRKYEQYETEVMMKNIDEGDVVVDVGANIGYYSVLVAEKVGPKGRVFAIEPEEKNFEILKKNIETNKFRNVKLIKAGAGVRNEERILEVSQNNYGDHRVGSQISDVRCQEKERQRVKIIRLDDVIEDKVDLLKIDTQGFEPYVIEGSKRIIEEDRPEIFLEYTPEVYENKKNREIIEELFGKYKYIRIVDDYLNIVIEAKSPIEKYCKNKKGYCDLWLSNKKIGWVEKYGKIRVKKLIRQLLGLPQTG